MESCMGLRSALSDLSDGLGMRWGLKSRLSDDLQLPELSNRRDGDPVVETRLGGQQDWVLSLYRGLDSKEFWIFQMKPHQAGGGICWWEEARTCAGDRQTQSEQAGWSCLYMRPTLPTYISTGADRARCSDREGLARNS